MEIRPFTETDWPQVWPIVREIVRAADTFAYDPAMTEAEARAIWIESPPGLTVVALEDERILGSAKMGPNRPGPGSHVATASFMVAAEARGRGVGTALCRYALDWARARLRRHAVQCRRRIQQRRDRALSPPRLPHRRHRSGAFAHPTLGRVGLHVMYRAL